MPFVWANEQQKLFDELKRSLSRAPLLKSADCSLPDEVTTDASDTEIGGALTQTKDGETHTIACASQNVNEAERNYIPPEKELLAVYMLSKHGQLIFMDQSL